MAPSSVLNGERLGAVLIDDDPLVRSLWLIAARKASVALLSFSSAEEFFAEAKNIEVVAPIYIDSRLADGVRGEVVAQEIFSSGFKEIYLVTGYRAEIFPEMPWIRRVLPKDPPWDNC
jgi:hypothetical protein